MSWSYLPLTEAECQNARFDLLERGFYEARIDKTEIKTSAKGNPMLVADLIVFDKSGEGREIKDFLVNTKQMMWKQRHLAVSAGLEKEFMDQTFHPSMLNGRMVRVEVGVQIGAPIPDDKLNGKPKGAKYPDRNIIEDYVVDNTGFEEMKDAPVKQDEFNDVIPF